MESAQQPITNFLDEIKSGNNAALEQLLPPVYDELRRLANSYLRKECGDHTLQPTALVHEADLRLIGQNSEIALDTSVSFSNQNQLDIVAVDEALTKLENMDERQARIVEMKFFGGLTIEEIGEVLSNSPTTVKREWSSAKLLLYKILND